MGVKLLGTSVESIPKAEDREAFKALMDDIGEPVIESVIAKTPEQALDFARQHGYPLIVRPAYTLAARAAHRDGRRRVGGDHQRRACRSRVCEVLIEKSVAGYKEIEYEVIRTAKATASPFATWRTSIRWASIRATAS